MARTILTVMLIVLVNISAGCYKAESGRSVLISPAMKQGPEIKIKGATEADLVEQMALEREAYRQGLKALTTYYKNSGDNMKLAWAKDELKSLNSIRQYNYIVEATLAGPDLKARNSITEADYMYADIVRLEKKAGQLLIVKNEDILRESLYEYNRLIKKHPSSDKIDDAAYRAGGIAEYFRDYSIALLYYQRAYQWDSQTPHPAKYKAALILDLRLSRRAEALELYKQAVKEGKLSKSYKEFAEQRIAELTKSDEAGK